MLNTVGPQMVGATDLKSVSGQGFGQRTLAKDFKSSNSESSFGKTLEKASQGPPKENKSKEEVSEFSQGNTKAHDDPENLRNADSSEMKTKDRSESPPKLEARSEDNRAEQKVAKPDGISKRKTASRQQAIKEFMDSFESEFQIPPTRLVEAMAQLDDSQLKESPEKTADAVIEQLGLDETQANKARAMYASLLMQLQQAQPNKPTAEMSSSVGLSSQNIQARWAATQERQSMLGSSVENLNKKFWMTRESSMPAGPGSQAMPSLNGDLIERMGMDDSLMNPQAADASAIETPRFEMPPSKLGELPPHLQGQMNESISPALLAALAAKKAASSPQAEGERSEDSADLNEEFTQALESPQPEGNNMRSQNAVAAKMGAQEFFQQPQGESQGQSLMQNSREFMQQQGANSQAKGASSGKLSSKSVEFKSAMTGLEGLQAPPMKAEALKLDSLSPSLAPAAPMASKSSSSDDTAVKQLMNQAQYLIKKGGGEVKVEMTPEGMGTVHLKVMLQDGKVNLQMSADTQEAKKTIESSLADLKNSLAAHKLSVENVKVDVVNSTSTDTATQNQSNTNGQNQHREARQFWNQFNDNFGNQGRREALTDFQNVRGYGGRRRDPLQPIETDSSSAEVRSVNGKGSGLNLVA